MAARPKPPKTWVLLAIASLVLAPLMATARAQVLGVKWTGQDGARFGRDLSNAGDVDQDGVDDLIVGEWRYDTISLVNAGRASIYSGATLALIRTHEGSTDSEYFGYSVTGAGDVDEDGYDDYAVGGKGYNTSAYTDAGRIVVYSGNTGNVIWTAYGDESNAELGFVIAGIDDLDGDGKPELAAGMPNADKVHVYDGFGNLYDVIVPSGPGVELGFSVALAGDGDGDGIDDFMDSAPAYSSSKGVVSVRKSSDSLTLFYFLGDTAGDLLGWSLAGIGDVDGDGIPDIAAGAPNASSIHTYGGYVRIASGADGSTLRTHYGDAVDDQMGYAVANVGDLDRDGFEDYAGTSLRGGTYDRGLVRIFSGQHGSVLFEFDGVFSTSEENTFLGSAMANGDFNGDGIPDLALGDSHFWEFDPSSTWHQIGGVWIYYGCPAWWENYGAGWPGKNGVPSLVALDDPGVGESIDVQLDNSLGASTVAVLFVGLSDASIVSSAGGTLLVSPFVAIPIALPAGGITLSGTLPNDPALYFVDVYLQALEADSFASKKLSFTPGLRLRCGFDL